MGTEEIDQAVRHVLRGLGAAYEMVPCDPALADTAAFCQAYGYSLGDSANTIVVAGKAQPPLYAACVVLADTRLDVNRTVKQRLGVRRASFASADETAALTGMMIGGVTVFALPPHLPIWVDERVMARERIILGGGSRSWKVVAPPDILRHLPNVEIVGSLAVDRPRPEGDGDGAAGDGDGPNGPVGEGDGVSAPAPAG
jgi:prolyl-tRNA editing enzyme YbaK/EbsC (Cys-tRNA(Pro) deacylase)